jgi:hypothetical protein
LKKAACRFVETKLDPALAERSQRGALASRCVAFRGSCAG